MKPVFFSIAILAVIPAAVVAAGQDAIPVAHAAGRYEASWKRNPFLRVVCGGEQPRHVWSRDWVLGGMAEFEGKTLANIINTKTGEYRRLGSAGSKGSGMRLLRVHFSCERAESFAEVEKDGETAILKYPDASP